MIHSACFSRQGILLDFILLSGFGLDKIKTLLEHDRRYIEAFLAVVAFLEHRVQCV